MTSASGTTNSPPAEARPLRLLPTLGIAALGLFAYWAATQGLSGVTIGKVAPLELASVFAFFLLITVCTERAVQVVLNAIFGPAIMEISKPLKQVVATEQLKNEKMQAGLSMMETAQERVAFITSNAVDAIGLSEGSRQAVATANADLTKISQQKLPIAVLTASLIGLLLSVSGIHLLAALAGASGVALPTGEPQSMLFRFADILVTTFVIAGGADGIHQIVKQYVGTASDIQSLLRSLKA